MLGVKGWVPQGQMGPLFLDPTVISFNYFYFFTENILVREKSLRRGKTLSRSSCPKIGLLALILTLLTVVECLY